jgi:hypothetical protein
MSERHITVHHDMPRHYNSDMCEGKSSISKASSYKEIGEFWDTHDLADYWDQLELVEFEVNLQSEVTYYPLKLSLSHKIRSVAKRQGVSAETLINLWIQEKLLEESA